MSKAIEISKELVLQNTVEVTSFTDWHNVFNQICSQIDIEEGHMVLHVKKGSVWKVTGNIRKTFAVALEECRQKKEKESKEKENRSK